jgi:Stress responsive A/B Barrel Domain
MVRIHSCPRLSQSQKITWIGGESNPCFDDVRSNYCQRVVIPLFFTKLMLTHIVCWKYKAETTPEMRADHRAKLMALPEIIRNSVSFNVGEDILHLERSFDTGLVAVFTDRAALDFYSDHPEHQKVAALGRGISERVVSVDFLSE